jgi:hypothetical protein
MGKITWYVKQLFPLTYRSRFTENGRSHFCVWRMWLGHCFNIDDIIVAGS